MNSSRIPPKRVKKKKKTKRRRRRSFSESKRSLYPYLRNLVNESPTIHNKGDMKKSYSYLVKFHFNPHVYDESNHMHDNFHVN